MMARAAPGLLLLAAAVTKKTPQNIDVFVTPDGQILLDADTYATVESSNGSSYEEVEHRSHHHGYAQLQKGQTAADPDAAPTKLDADPSVGGQSEDELPKSPEEERGCVDTEGWVNGFSGPSTELADYWLEAEVEIENAGHNGVMLWLKEKGNTCAAYVFMGACVNLRWIDQKADDYPCMMNGDMGGEDWNYPEQNCCACGKAHVSKGAECSNETKIAVLMHRKDMEDTIEIAFEGTRLQRQQHDWDAGEGAGAVLSLLAIPLAFL